MSEIHNYRINLEDKIEGFKSIHIEAYTAQDAEYIAARVMNCKDYKLISIRPEVKKKNEEVRER